MTGLANIFAVARREYTTRIRTRSFLFGTLILLLSVIAIAFAPIIVEAIDQTSQQKIAVHVTATDLQSDPVTTVSVLMNASANPSATTTDVKPDFVVSAGSRPRRGPSRRHRRRIRRRPGDRPDKRRRSRLHALHGRQRGRSHRRPDPPGIDLDRGRRQARATRRCPDRPGEPVRACDVRRRVARPRPDRSDPGDDRSDRSEHAGVRDDGPDLHDDHHLRHVDRAECRGGEVIAGDGGHPQRGHAVPAADRQGPRCRGDRTDAVRGAIGDRRDRRPRTGDGREHRPRHERQRPPCLGA